MDESLDVEYQEAVAPLVEHYQRRFAVLRDEFVSRSRRGRRFRVRYCADHSQNEAAPDLPNAHGRDAASQAGMSIHCS